MVREEMGSVIEIKGQSHGQNCLLLSALRSLPEGLRAVAALDPHLAPADSSRRLGALRAALSRVAWARKSVLVPVANLVAEQQGRAHDFSVGPADVEMLLAWCLSFCPITSLAVAAHGQLRAVRYSHPSRPATPENPEVFVFCDMRTEPQPDGSVRDCSHFQALVPVGPRGPPAPSSGPRAGPAGVTCPQRQVDEATCALASEIARSARPLHVLAPPSTWARPQTDAWVRFSCIRAQDHPCAERQ